MKTKLHLVTLLLIATIIGTLHAVNNVPFLIFLADSSGSGSVIRNLSMRTLYKKHEKDIKTTLIGNFRDSSNIDEINTYIKVIGVFGLKNIETDFMTLYINIQNDRNARSTLSYLVSSMGLIESNSFESLLETVLHNYDKHSISASQYEISRSLYLLTGKKFPFVNIKGQKQELFLTEELINIKRVIEESKGRDRTFEEKILFDTLFQ